MLAGLLLSGCASSFKFLSQKDLEPFDRALREGMTIEQPAAELAAGEKLTYEVSWIGIPVGHVILENHGLEKVGWQDAYHLTFKTVSNEFLSKFFHVEDTVHTWISRAGGYPVRFEKRIQEGSYSKYQIVEFDHERLVATYTTKNGTKTMEIPSGVQDIFSILYWVRKQDLNSGGDLIKDVNADEKNWVVRVEVLEQGLFETEAMGKVRAFSLRPTADSGQERLQKAEGVVWMTADRRRIPLAFQVKAKILGNINAVLSEAVLPPLSEYRFLAGNDSADLLERVYCSGSWIGGLTQSDTLGLR